ncbi:hypothetical protein N665_0775s0001 [Sinapis alba]|nr:hypothetical protein N665_0775s0001 [Sinapis alba]
MVIKLNAQGSTGVSDPWDDGFDYDDVAKINVQGGNVGIRCIYFDYVKSGKIIESSCHGADEYGFSKTFEINHQNKEYLESVDVYYTPMGCIQALQFKTNFKTSELMGSDKAKDIVKFTLAVEGQKIIGFHGVSILTLGAHVTSIPPTRLKAKGGKGGKEWDDGGDHDNVSKIHVVLGFEGISSIVLDYVKNGQVKSGLIHGDFRNGLIPLTFEIDSFNEEYLASVEGYYDEVSKVIQGLRFITNNNKIGNLLGDAKGVKFSLSDNGSKIIGFHGYADRNINSLGAYFISLPPAKLECQGTLNGFLWDDGSNHDGVTKVCVTLFRDCWIGFVRFEYDNNGKREKTNHRREVAVEKEFEVDYPHEFITSVEGAFVRNSADVSFFTSLTFKTSKHRTSPTYGRAQVGGEIKFVLEKKGNALVGFHGRSNHCVTALGAYYRQLPIPITTKLKGGGGVGGDFWDDGHFYGVKKIIMGLCEKGIAFVKFTYYTRTEIVIGDDHGDKTIIDEKEVTDSVSLI